MEYNFKECEQIAREKWQNQNVYKVYHYCPKYFQK